MQLRLGGPLPLLAREYEYLPQIPAALRFLVLAIHMLSRVVDVLLHSA